MTLALEPGNAEAFMRVYSKFSLPIRRKTAELAVSLYNAGKAGSLIAALESASKEQPDWLRERLAELHDNFTALRTDTAREALDRIRYEMGYGGYVLKDSGDKERMYLLSILAAREKNTESFLQRLRELESISSESRTQRTASSSSARYTAVKDSNMTASSLSTRWTEYCRPCRAAAGLTMSSARPLKRSGGCSTSPRPAQRTSSCL